MSRAAKTALGVLAGLAAIAVLALVALVVITQTDWGREQVRRIALEQLEAAAEGEVEVGRVEGDLLRRIRFVDVAIRDLEGRPFVRADTVATGFSLWGLLRQRIVLRNLRLVNAHLVLDQPPGEEWNYQRIFPLEPPVEPAPPPGWGDWILLQDVELVNTRVTVRTEWEPSDTLAPAQRARAIEEALSEDTRPNVQRVPGGYQNVMDFRQLTGRFPRARIADPDEDQMVFEVASLSGIAQPFRPPAAEVHNLAGEVRLSEDSIWFREIEAVLPGSRIRAGGVYALKTAEYLLDLRGDPLAFDDLRWLYPPLPERGGGTLRLALHQREFTTLIVAEDADLQVGDSRLGGRFGLVFGDTVRFRETDLRFADLDTRLIEQLVPELELPRQGLLTGELALTGPTAAMDVDADVVFADARVGVSRVVAVGTAGMEDEVRFDDLLVRLEPLRVDLVREQVPQLPAGGALEGVVRLTGSPANLLHLDGDLTLRDPRTGASRIQADGAVALNEELLFRDLHLRFQPVQVALLRQELPQLPPTGTLSGYARLNGSTTGPLRLDSELALRDPRTGLSRIRAVGEVDPAGEHLRFRDLRVQLDPLQVDLLRAQLPDLPPGATLSGPLRLNGSTAALLQVDGDLTVRDPQTGVSRLLASGGVGIEPEIRFRELDLRFDPLQMALVGAVAPEMPIGGVLTGTARLNGSPAARLTARADLVHLERGERSQVVGEAEIAMQQEWAAVDLRLEPLSLQTVGRFAPEAGLRGSAVGALQARGDLRNLAIWTDLRLPDGGELVVQGTLDLASEQPGYDLASQLRIFNLATVTERAPAATSLTGAIEARGRGFDPATMRATLAADLVGAEVDEVAADEVRLRLAIADGLARVDSSIVRVTTAEAFADGSFGLAPHRQGELAYRVAVDSLHAFAPWVPAADTGVVELRPAVREEALAEARAEAQRAAEARQVEWLATGHAPPPEPVDTITPAQVPRDSLAGSIHAAGRLRGNLERFDLSGRAQLEEVLYQGNYVGSGMADYALIGLGTPEPDVELEASLHTVLAAGFAFDSADARVRYRGERFGAGEAVIVAYQDDETDFRADLEFALALDRSELRLQDLELRFDTVHWSATRPALISWDEAAVAIDTLELQSGARGRIFVDGRVPVEGAGDLQVLVQDLQVAHVVALLQEDTEARGLLSVDAHVQGTLRNPRFEGQLGLVDGWLERSELPEIRAGFSYADAALTADAQLLRQNHLLAVIEGALPIDLALVDQEGPRLLDAPLALDVRADSLPLDALPALTDQVEDLRGRLIGEISVRGSVDDPVLDGLVNLDLASFGVAAVGVRFEDVAGTLRMDGQTLYVDSLVAWSTGPVRITGELDLSSLTAPGFDLQVVAQDARVLDNEHGRIWVDADVEVAGPFDAVAVSGQAHVLRGVLYIPETRPHVIDLDDPEILATLDPGLLAQREALVDPMPLLENLEVDVELFISPDTWVRSVEANVEIYTVPEVGPLALQYNGANGRLALEGTINSDRGDYSFMGRRFQVTRGAAIFVGGEFDPLLQIAAEHEVRLTGREPLEIRIVISGTATEPTIELESSEQPPIPETDLLSYLAFGRSASSLMQHQGSSLGGQQTGGGPLGGEVAGLATQQLAAVAVNTLVTEFERDAARSLGLDVLHISPADLPAEIARGRFDFVNALRGTEIEMGTYIGPRLFLAGQARPTLIRPGARVEYRSPGGFRWITAWEPRFLAPVPTLTPIEPERTSVFGAFLLREWRF